MINEPESLIVEGFSSLWNDLVPWLEPFLYDARKNFLVKCFRDSIESSGSSVEAAVVNEVAFELARLAWLSEEHPNAIVHAHPEYPSLVERCIEKISRISGQEIEAIPAEREREVSKIASRLIWMLQHRLASTPLEASEVTFNPEFRGCGLLGPLRGDLCARGILAEVKAGKRSVQSKDFRQLLLYAALAAEAGEEVQSLGWLNPRLGTMLTVSIEEFSGRASGTPWFELKNSILSSLGVAFSR